jgi:hypothetical protein
VIVGVIVVVSVVIRTSWLLSTFGSAGLLPRWPLCWLKWRRGGCLCHCRRGPPIVIRLDGGALIAAIVAAYRVVGVVVVVVAVFVVIAQVALLLAIEFTEKGGFLTPLGKGARMCLASCDSFIL